MSEQTSIGEWRKEALCRRLGLPTDIFSRGRCTNRSQQCKRAGVARSVASVSRTSSDMRLAGQRRLQGFLEA